MNFQLVILCDKMCIATEAEKTALSDMPFGQTFILALSKEIH